MGDPRTEKEHKVFDNENNEPIKIVPVINHFAGPATIMSTSGIVKVNAFGPLDVCSMEGNNCVEKLDMMTRSLEFCRKIPCMGIIFALMSALFFGIAALVVKSVPTVNPLVIIIFQ